MVVVLITVLYLALLPSGVVSGKTVEDITIWPDYGYETDGSITINVSRATVDNSVLTFRYQTRDNDGGNTATTDVDYDSTSGTGTIAANQASTTFAIPINADMDEDRGERFRIRLNQFSDGNSRIREMIYIIDDSDVDFQCPVEIWGVEIDEKIELTLRRSSADSHGPMTVLVTTVEDGTAVEGEEYVGITNEVLEFADKETKKTISIKLIDDVIYEEDDKTFTVTIGGDRVAACSINAFIVDDDKPDPFHCNRGTSQQCYNSGVCNTVNGKCKCPDPYERPNCFRDSTKTCTNAENNCENGWCMKDDAGVVSCICRGGWTGDTCSNPAYHVQCNANTFGICISMYDMENFNGVVFVVNKSDTDACVLKRVTAPGTNPNLPEWCNGYFIDLPYNGTDCGTFEPTYEGSVATFTAQFIVQYTTGFVKRTDELFTAFCRVDEDQQVFRSSVIEVDAALDYYKKQTTSTEFTPVKMAVTYPNGGPLRAVIPLRQVFKVCLSVEEAALWGCIVIRDITLTNGRKEPYFEQETIFENGCVNPLFKFMYVKTPDWEPATNETMCFTLTPVIFEEDRGLDTVKMALGVAYSIYPPSVECPRLECVGSTTTRRRREAANGEEEGFEEVVVEIEASPAAATDPETETHNTGSLAAVQEDSKIQLPLVVGASVGGCLLLGVILIVAAIAYSRGKRQRKSSPAFY